MKRITDEAENIKEVINLERENEKSMNFSDKIANKITAFSGSMLYVGLHVLWFGGWIVINLGIIQGIKAFDPFPFSLLTLIVSLEAIFLSSFVLISQNKQSQQADRRARIDLQINMLAERENTTLIKMVAQIHRHLKINKSTDPQIRKLAKDIDVRKIAKNLDKAEAKS